MPRPPLDYTNKKYNHLTGVRYNGTVVSRRDSTRTRTDSEWVWLCDCGKEITKLARHVKRGFVKSCGCHVNRGWREVAHHVWNRYRQDDKLAPKTEFISEEDFIKLSQLPCHYCGEFNFNKRHNKGNYWEYHGLDRLNNDKGHTLDNVVSCCWRCNEKKSDDSEPEFLEWIKLIYLHRVVK